MKFVINEYSLSSPKIRDNIDIICITDIHSNVEKLKAVSKLIKKFQIKTILISGDLIDTVEDKRNNELLKVLKDISKNSFIYIAKGNHDIIKNRNKKMDNLSLENEFYKRLSLVKNIKVFNNDVDSISLTDRIDLHSLTLPLEWYLKREKSKYFDIYVKKDIRIDKSKFNILLSHTPRPFIKDNLIKQDIGSLSDMNLILCGHMHAGLKPICLRKNNKHRGLVGPCKILLPKDAYGFYNNNDSSLIISGGITKISHLSGGKYITRVFDNMFVSEIEFIHFKFGKKQHLELVKRNIVEV